MGFLERIKHRVQAFADLFNDPGKAIPSVGEKVLGDHLCTFAAVPQAMIKVIQSLRQRAQYVVDALTPSSRFSRMIGFGEYPNDDAI
ncbi:hypothetical protein Kisp02_67480 [Kineosporia sp. NBRC 101731]|nr:hypothetical protein Kisp02_67480 [Kineosporia sp. NBRC 101731]